MATVISIANQKGGVGKTTTAVNFAAYAALAKRTTLVIDNDPQANTTSVFAPKHADEGSFFSTATVIDTGRDRIRLGPSGSDLLSLDLAVNQQQRSRFPTLVEAAAKEHDLVVIDCPPSLTFLPLESFRASDMVLIPIQCEYYAMEGLGQILEALQDMDDQSRPPLVRIVLTMFEAGSALCRDVADEIRRYFPSDCLQTVIPRDMALAAAPSHAASIAEYDPLSPGALAYLQASKEILNAIR